MPQIDWKQMYALIEAEGLIPVFSNSDDKVNCAVLTACASGGARLFEFTNRVPNALDRFRHLKAYADEKHPEIVLGVGTVLRLDDAEQFWEAGAQFLVGPNFDTRIANAAVRRKAAYSPGCETFTELCDAQEILGCDAVLKLFPAKLKGPDYVKMILPTNRSLKLMVTGGVGPDTLDAWFTAGVVAAGMGSELIPKDCISDSNWPDIQRRVRDARQTVRRLKTK